MLFKNIIIYFYLTVLVVVIGCNNKNLNELTDKKLEAISDKSFAIVNVNLIPMTTNIVLKSQTVLIKDGLIESIFNTGSIKISKQYKIIDGTGYYLMPGLADMHTHILETKDLNLNVYNGVTTILNMGGSSDILKMRSQIQRRELIGPQIFASVFIDGTERSFWLADGSEVATEAVKKFKKQGWDFIKVYNSIASESYFSLIEEGEKQNIAIIGHGVREVGMEKSLKAGQKMIAHSEEYIYTYFGKNLDENLIPKIVKITKESGAYVTANLSTYESINAQWGNKYLEFRKKTLNRSEIKYLSKKVIDSWSNSKRYANRPGNLDERLLFLRILTKEMHKSGVPLLLGTDSPSPDIVGMIPGFSIYDDLTAYKKVGLSNYEALKTGTVNAGNFIQKNLSEKLKFGIIKEGYRADLILLKNNPISDISNIKKIVGVMLNGSWLDRNKLDRLLIMR